MVQYIHIDCGYLYSNKKGPIKPPSLLHLWRQYLELSVDRITEMLSHHVEKILNVVRRTDFVYS